MNICHILHNYIIKLLFSSTELLKDKNLSNIHQAFVASEGTESVHEFVMPDFSNQKKEFMSDKGIYGMEVCTENNTICMPFIDGGAVTFVVTINQGQVSVDAGSITAGNVLLDFYHSNLNMGDEIRVTLKNLDFVSSPLSERSFSGHTL